MANLGEISIDINANISKAQAKLKQLEKQLNLVVDVKLPKLNSTGTTAQYKGGSNDDCCDRLNTQLTRVNSNLVNLSRSVDNLPKKIADELKYLKPQKPGLLGNVFIGAQRRFGEKLADTSGAVASAAVNQSLKEFAKESPELYRALRVASSKSSELLVRIPSLASNAVKIAENFNQVGAQIAAMMKPDNSVKGIPLYSQAGLSGKQALSVDTFVGSGKGAEEVAAEVHKATGEVISDLEKLQKLLDETPAPMGKFYNFVYQSVEAQNKGKSKEDLVKATTEKFQSEKLETSKAYLSHLAQGLTGNIDSELAKWAEKSTRDILQPIRTANAKKMKRAADRMAAEFEHLIPDLDPKKQSLTIYASSASHEGRAGQEQTSSLRGLIPNSQLVAPTYKYYRDDADFVKHGNKYAQFVSDKIASNLSNLISIVGKKTNYNPNERAGSAATTDLLTDLLFGYSHSVQTNLAVRQAAINKGYQADDIQFTGHSRGSQVTRGTIKALEELGIQAKGVGISLVSYFGNLNPTAKGYRAVVTGNDALNTFGTSGLIPTSKADAFVNPLYNAGDGHGIGQVSLNQELLKVFRQVGFKGTEDLPQNTAKSKGSVLYRPGSDVPHAIHLDRLARLLENATRGENLGKNIDAGIYKFFSSKTDIKDGLDAIAAIKELKSVLANFGLEKVKGKVPLTEFAKQTGLANAQSPAALMGQSLINIHNQFIALAKELGLLGKSVNKLTYEELDGLVDKVLEFAKTSEGASHKLIQNLAQPYQAEGYDLSVPNRQVPAATDTRLLDALEEAEKFIYGAVRKEQVSPKPELHTERKEESALAVKQSHLANTEASRVDVEVLGKFEEKIVTLLNKVITPNTGKTASSVKQITPRVLGDVLFGSSVRATNEVIDKLAKASNILNKIITVLPGGTEAKFLTSKVIAPLLASGGLNTLTHGASGGLANLAGDELAGLLGNLVEHLAPLRDIPEVNWNHLGNIPEAAQALFENQVASTSGSLAHVAGDVIGTSATTMAEGNFVIANAKVGINTVTGAIESKADNLRLGAQNPQQLSLPKASTYFTPQGHRITEFTAEQIDVVQHSLFTKGGQRLQEYLKDYLNKLLNQARQDLAELPSDLKMGSKIASMVGNLPKQIARLDSLEVPKLSGTQVADVKKATKVSQLQDFAGKLKRDADLIAKAYQAQLKENLISADPEILQDLYKFTQNLKEVKEAIDISPIASVDKKFIELKRNLELQIKALETQANSVTVQTSPVGDAIDVNATPLDLKMPAKNVTSGLAKGLSQHENVNKQALDLGEAIIEYIDMGTDSHSPSRKAIKSAQNVINGLIIGLKANGILKRESLALADNLLPKVTPRLAMGAIAGMQTAGSELSQKMLSGQQITSVGAGLIVAKSLKSGLEASGVDIVGGINSGIRKGIPSLQETFLQLGTTSVSSFKKAIGSNSPAKKFIAPGLDSILGIIQGLEKGSPLLDSKFKEVAKTGLKGIGEVLRSESLKIDPELVKLEAKINQIKALSNKKAWEMPSLSYQGTKTPKATLEAPLLGERKQLQKEETNFGIKKKVKIKLDVTDDSRTDLRKWFDTHGSQLVEGFQNVANLIAPQFSYIISQVRDFVSYLDRSFPEVMNAFRGLGNAILPLGTLGLTIAIPTIAIAKFGKQAIDTARQFSLLEATINSFGGGSTLAANLSVASKELINLKSLAQGLPQYLSTTFGGSLEGDTNTYVSLQKSLANRGIGGQQADRANTALLQMLSKGKVSMEELRQQLSEALPGTMQIAARAYNQSVGQFVKAVSKGTIGGDDFYNRFVKQLTKESTGFGDNQSAQLTKLENAWDNLGTKAELALGKILLGFASFNTAGLLETLEGAGKAIDYVAERAGIFIGSLLALSAIQLARPIWLAVEAITFANATGFKLAGSLGLAQKAAAGFGAVMKQAFIIGGVLALADVIQGVFTSGVLDSVKAIQSLKKELNSLPQDTAKSLSSGSGVLDFVSGITRGLSGGNVKEFNKARRAYGEKEISAEEFEQMVNPVGAMKRIESNDAYAQKLGSISAELIGVDAAVNKITLADKKVQDFIANVKQLEKTKAALQVQIIAGNITPEQRDAFKVQIEQIQSQMDALKLDVIPNGDPAQIETQIDAIKRAFDDSVQKGFKTEADRPAMEALVSRMRSTSSKIKGFWKELENTTNISTALKELGNNFDALRTKIDAEDSQRKTSVTNLILSRKIKPEEEGLYQQNNAVEQARDKWKSFNEELQQTQELIKTVSTADLSVLESVIGKSYKDFNSADIEKLKSQGEVTPFTPTQQAAIEALEKQLVVTKELEGATNSYGDALVAQQKANDEFIRQLHTIADIMAIVKGYAEGVKFENTFKVASNAVNSSAYLANNPQLSDNKVQQIQFRDRLNEALNNKNSSDYSVKIKIENLKALRYGVQEELNKLKIGDVSKMDMSQLNQLEATLAKINKTQPVSGDLMAYVAGYKEIRENQLQVLQDSKAINDVIGEIKKWKFENWTSFGITVAELNTQFAALASIAKELNEVTDRAFNQNALSNLQSSTGSRTGDTFRSQQEELQRLEDYTKNAQSGLNQLKEAFSNWKQPDELSFEGDKFTMPIQAIQNLLDSAANGTIKLSGESKAYLETLKNIRQQSDDVTAAQTRLWTEIAERQIPAATRALIDYQATIGALEFKLKGLSSGSKIGILRNAIANQSTEKEYQRADRGNNIQLLNEELSLRQRILKAKEAAALIGLNGEEKSQLRELVGGNPLKATRQDLEEALGILNAAPKAYSEGVKQSVESLRQLSDEKLDFKRAQENQLSAVFDIIKSQQDLVKSIKNAAKSLKEAARDLKEKQDKLAKLNLYQLDNSNPSERFKVPSNTKFIDLDSQIQSELKSKYEGGKTFINSMRSLIKEYQSLIKDLDKNIRQIELETKKALLEIKDTKLEAAGIRKYGNQGFAADMFKTFNDVFKAFTDIGKIEEVDKEKFENQIESYQERISQATQKEAEAREELANKILEANQKIAQRFEELAKEQEKAAEEVRAAQEKVAEATQELANLTNDYNSNNSLLNSVGVEFKGAAQEQISAATALKQAAAALGAAAGKPINLGDLSSFRSASTAQYHQPQYNPAQSVAQYQAPANLSALRAQLHKDVAAFNKRVADRDRERASIEKDKKYSVPGLAAYSQPTNWNELAPRYAKMLANSRQLEKEYQQIQVRTKQLYENVTTSVTQTSSTVASANQAISKAVNRTGMYPNGTVDVRNIRYLDGTSKYDQDPKKDPVYVERSAEGRKLVEPWEKKAKARFEAFKKEAERNINVNVELNTSKADVKLAELEAKINEIYIDLPRQLADKQRQAQDAVFSYREYQNQYLPNRNDSINLAGDKIETEIKRKAQDMRLQAQELRAKDSKTLDINDFTSRLNDLKSSGKVSQDVIQKLEEKLRQAASGSISLSEANNELIATLEANANDLDKIAPTAGAIERIKLAHLYSQNLAKVQQDIGSQLMEAKFQSLGSGLSPYYEKRLRAEMELANFASKAAERRQSTVDTMRENKASNDEIERTLSLLDQLDKIEFSNLQNNTKVLQKEILDGLGGALEQTLSSFFKAETSLGEAFANLGRSVLQMFADIAAKAVTAKLMGWIGGMFGMGGGGLPLFKDGGEVGVKRFATGGSVPRFDSGGSIQDALALGLGVKRSLALEGNGAVPVVAHKGEQILTDLNGDAQLFRALQKSGEWTQIKSDRVNRYATGGTVGYAGSDLGRVSNSRDKFVRNNNVNTQITVVAKDANSFVKAKSQIQRDMQAEQQRAAQRLS